MPSFPTDDVSEPLSVLCGFCAGRDRVVGTRHAARFFSTGAIVVQSGCQPSWPQFGTSWALFVFG